MGIDGVTKERYGHGLEANLADLSGRLKRMGYHPQPKRRSYIPKAGSDKGRPLGISCFEDKLVELAVKNVLEPIYEERALHEPFLARQSNEKNVIFSILQNQMLITFDFGGASLRHEILHFVQKSHFIDLFGFGFPGLGNHRNH